MHCIVRLGAAAPEWRLAIEEVHNGNDGARAGIGENENDVVCRSQPPLAAAECKEPIVLWRIGSSGEREGGGGGADKVACRTAKWMRRGGG